MEGIFMSKAGMRRPESKEPNATERKLNKKSGEKNPPALQGSKNNKTDIARWVYIDILSASEFSDKQAKFRW